MSRLKSQDSIEGMQKTLGTLSQKLASDPEYFRKVYSYTFDFARPDGQRSLGMSSYRLTGLN